jgi:very-short-patch-repair endonuclease
MSERTKLSLGSGDSAKADKTASWNISEARKDKLHDRARFNRRHPSEAHKRMWGILKDKGVDNFAFNREVVMGSSVVDFACKARWLVVEISGETEADAKIEELTDRKLNDVGVRVMRFSQEQVMGDLELVKAAILEELEKPFDKPGRSKPERPDYEDREFNRRGSIR